MYLINDNFFLGAVIKYSQLQFLGQTKKYVLGYKYLKAI